jgi:hypothetical protein
MGLFTDVYCTLDADSSVYTTFYSNYGFPLPHANSTLVEENCISCNYGNGNGQYQVSDMCSSLYLMSGKCESNLQGQISSPITSGCSFLSELTAKTDGYVAAKPSSRPTTVQVSNPSDFPSTDRSVDWIAFDWAFLTIAGVILVAGWAIVFICRLRHKIVLRKLDLDSNLQLSSDNIDMAVTHRCVDRKKG